MFFYNSPWGTLNVPWVTNVSRKICLLLYFYIRQLRHFVRSNELVENVDLTDETNHEIFEHGDGDSWESEDDLELMDSDESENA